jgi:hypothetical protein
MGVPIAQEVDPPENETNDHADVGRNRPATVNPVGGNVPAAVDPVAALRLELVQMMHDMQAGMLAQMATHLGNNRGPAQGDMNGNVRYQRLEDSLQLDLPFDQAIRGGDSGLAVLNRGIGSLTAGTPPLTHVLIPTQSTSHSSVQGPTTSSGIDDALRQLTSIFQRGQDHMSPNDISKVVLKRTS